MPDLSPSGDFRLPKKQRRRDETPPDWIHEPAITPPIDCDKPLSNPVPHPSAVSYKDAVMGDRTTDPDDVILLDDDEIDLLEDDVRVGVQDGIPFIDFSERVREIATKSLTFTLVLSVLGHRVGYSALYNRRIIEPWSQDFDPSQSHPSRIMAWVQLPGLPITWYKRSLIEAIDSCIGSVVKVDYQTDYGRRGCFARMDVKINLKQPLVSKIMREAPTPEPLDAYGPWILVESRCPRSARVSKQPNHLDTAQIASQSRYNPIFAESNPTTQSPVIVDNRVNEPVAPAFHPMHDDMIQTSTATTTNVYPSFAPSPSATKSKSNGKAPVVIRKTPQAVLKPRDTNIMLKKNVGVSVWTGAAKKSSLNPDKHSIIVTSKSADPIILHNSNPKQLPSSPITDTQASST
ncbi:hypothetical protein V6N12_042358 [Hibiscus sabdariffa]|uniref:DUF4283 domain-containing protein n=1 Tax=Hibiscus sabdariffa TaxID=183260 RepID=A0ABR2EEJ1_9ROSI